MLRGSITYPQITWEKFCSSATTRAEYFSPDKSSAVLLPQLQNVSHQRNILLSCYHKDRMFLTREIFYCSGTTIADFFLWNWNCMCWSQSARKVAQSVLLLYSGSWCQSELADRLTGQTGSHLSGSNSCARCNEVTLVWGSLRLAPITYLQS